MNKLIKNAVILAAGRGQRINQFVNDRPKGFLQLGNKPIIEESTDKLRQHGIERITIVTGFQSKFYEALEERHSFITTVKNEKFNETGNLHSLCRLKDFINQDFTLLESDLSYDARAIKEIFFCPHPNVMLLSDFSRSGDGVSVKVDSHQYLINNCCLSAQ